jgi:hypothetical protein
MQKYKFVTKDSGPAVQEVTVALEDTEGGVTLVVGGYYICTLTHNGNLILHIGVHSDCIKTDDQGAIITAREK